MGPTQHVSLMARLEAAKLTLWWELLMVQLLVFICLPHLILSTCLPTIKIWSLLSVSTRFTVENFTISLTKENCCNVGKMVNSKWTSSDWLKLLSERFRILWKLSEAVFKSEQVVLLGQMMTVQDLMLSFKCNWKE